MVLVVSAIIVAGAIAWGCLRIAAALDAMKTEGARNRTLTVLDAFLPAVSAATADPHAILTWEPLARSARQLFPDEFAQLDRAWGSAFPLGSDRIQAAHARWTADWLAWEKSHDAEYKLKAAAIEEQLMRSEGSSLLRAQLDAIEREKLERYQRRYEEYVRVGKALQAFAT
jgi:hypothetical protein